jgi:hypothetical protein
MAVTFKFTVSSLSLFNRLGYFFHISFCVSTLLYLAISQLTFNNVFSIELGQVLLKNQIVKLIVFDDESEVIVQWIPD